MRFSRGEASAVRAFDSAKLVALEDVSGAFPSVSPNFGLGIACVDNTSVHYASDLIYKDTNHTGARRRVIQTLPEQLHALSNIIEAIILFDHIYFATDPCDEVEL
jgi:hypothetical protein